MTKNRFSEGEIPYGTLEEFALTREMIEDLPLDVTEQILDGGLSPKLPISIIDEEGTKIDSRSRFMLVRMEDGNVDVVFYPELKHTPLEQYTPEQQEQLRAGKAILADTTLPDGKKSKAFVQIDFETKQVMSAPTQIIGRNLQIIAQELNLGNAEVKVIQAGEALTFVMDDQPITVGVDLNEPSGLRASEGDEQQWRKQNKREWDKFTFGCYGCWIMDDDGNLSYCKEDDYSEELWSEQKKAGQRNAGRSM